MSDTFAGITSIPVCQSIVTPSSIFDVVGNLSTVNADRMQLSAHEYESTFSALRNESDVNLGGIIIYMYHPNAGGAENGNDVNLGGIIIYHPNAGGAKTADMYNVNTRS